MEMIQAKLERQGNNISVVARMWPDGRDILRARLRPHPQHPRAMTELLEAIARWEGKTVHAVVVVDEMVGSGLSNTLLDLAPEDTPLVEYDYVDRRSRAGRSGAALQLRGAGRHNVRSSRSTISGVSR